MAIDWTQVPQTPGQFVYPLPDTTARAYYQPMAHFRYPLPRPGIEVPENNPQQAVLNMQRRLWATGIEVPEEPKNPNLLLRALDILDRPRNALAMAIYNSLRGYNWQEGFMAGLRGQDRALGSDILRAMGVESRLGQAVGGFVTDVLLDPLTYVAVGPVTKAGTLLGRRAATEAAGLAATVGIRGPARRTAQELSEQFAEEMGLTQARRLSRPAMDSMVTRRHREIRDQLQEGLRATESRLSALEEQTFIGTAGEAFQQTEGLARQDLLTRLKEATDPQRIRETMDTQRRSQLIGEIQTRMAGRLDRESQRRLFQLDHESLALTKHIVEIFGTEVKAVDLFETARGMKKHWNEYLRFQDAAYRLKGFIEYRNGLTRAYFENRRSVLMFAGVPVFEFRPLSHTVGSTIVQTAYKASPAFRKVYDMFKGWFDNSYISLAYQQQMSPDRFDRLRQAVEVVDTARKREGSAAILGAEASVYAFGQDILMNERVRKNVVYYIEKDLSPTAKAKWDEVAAQMNFTPAEMKMFERAARVNQMLADLTYEQDLQLLKGLGYSDQEAAKILSKRELYVPHIVKGDPMTMRQRLWEHAVATGDERLGRELQVKHPHMLSRVFDSLADAQARGLDLEDDIVTIWGVRWSRTLQSITHLQFAETLKAVGDDVIRQITDKNREQLMAMGWKEANHIAALRGYAIHPEVYRHIQKFDQLFFNDFAFNELLQMVDAATNFIKGLQTSASPAFLARNFPGEALMNFIAGVGADAHRKANVVLNFANQPVNVRGVQIPAHEILSRVSAYGRAPYREGFTLRSGRQVTLSRRPVTIRGITMSQQEWMNALRSITVKIGGEDVPVINILQSFRNEGLEWSGRTKGDIVAAMEETIKTEVESSYLGYGKMFRREIKNPFRLWMYTGRRIGDWTESYFRMAHFIQRLDDGWELVDAANDVRRYHVDYRDLTGPEAHVLRRIMPYYTYMRHNVPIQLRILFENPRWHRGLGHLVFNSSHALGDPATSEYLEDGFAIPLYTDEDGNVRYLNWNLPLVDVGRIKLDMIENFREFVGMLHPGIRAPFEFLANRNLFLGVPLDRGHDVPLFPSMSDDFFFNPHVPPWMDYALSQLGILSQLRRTQIPGFEREAERFGQVERVFDSPLTQPLAGLGGSLLPLRNPRSVEAARAYAYRERLQRAISEAQYRGATVPTAQEAEQYLAYLIHNNPNLLRYPLNQ